MHVMDFFIDPILRAPTWGCILMGISTSLMGVVSFLKKRTLIGESLSHASYPGIILGVIFIASFFPSFERWSFLAVMFFAFLSSIIGLKVLRLLELRFSVKNDASLCFVLATFFGFGLLLASHMQFVFTNHYRTVQMYLYGQSATMTDIHIWIYALLTLLIISFLILYYRPLQMILFDAGYAKSIGISIKKIENITFFLLVLSIIVGTRSAGIVLVSGMLIAPVIAARQYTDKLHQLFFISAIISTLSTFLGNYLSVVISMEFSRTLPTGPLIVVISAIFAGFSLFFSPKKGLLFRMMRVWEFKRRCLQENILKYIWKKKEQSSDFLCIQKFFNISSIIIRLNIFKMRKKGWISYADKKYFLTPNGLKKAVKIVRLHRLWELYLADHLGMNVERVHRNADQMEHILTSELEERLLKILDNPTKDPHKQPIP